MAAQISSYYAQLRVALKAAVEAGQYFHSRIDSVVEVKAKSSPSDLVTDVDPECERLIRRHVAAAFPNHAVLGEESTEPGATASMAATAAVANAPRLWIIDPLDGTTNYVQRMPLSVVSIAYAEAGALRVGVIYDPYRDELFYATDGGGARITNASDALAFCDDDAHPFPGRAISVSAEDQLRRAVVATGFPTRGEARVWTTQAAMRLAGKVKSMRALGAAALHLAYVAAGRIDVFWEYELNAWDLAAGMLLVREAGGVISAIGGSAYHLETRNVVTGGRESVVRAIDEAVTVPGEDKEDVE